MIRVQRQRSKGWTMPENTVYCGRPTKWGNPLRLKRYKGYNPPFGSILVDASYRGAGWVDSGFVGDEEDLLHVFEMLLVGKEFMNKDMDHWSRHFGEVDWRELWNKDLACWCPLDKPCHVDVIISLLSYPL